MNSHPAWTFGANRASFEPPDLLTVQFRGVCDIDCTRWSAGLYKELGSRHPFYLLADIADSRHTQEARKHLVETLRAEWFLGVAYIGASPEQRAVSSGLMLAVIKTSKLPYLTHYVSTLEEARQWVEAQRAKRKQGL